MAESVAFKQPDENGSVVYTVSGNLIDGGSGAAFDRCDGWAIVPGSSIRIELVTGHSVRD